MKPFEKRFGMIAVGKGFITLEQLLEAIKIQVSEDVDDKKSHRLIGEILIEMGLLNPPQIRDVLGSMDRDMRIHEKINVRE